MKIALIGGKGFIGREVSKKLNKEDLIIIDSACESNVDKEIKCDIRDYESLVSHLKGVNIAFIFSAISEAAKNTQFPINSTEVNLLGLVNILSACVNQKVSRVVFCSSSWVYSDENIESNSIVTEKFPLNCNKETNMYSCLKICGELITRSFYKEYGLEYTILRFGTVYGDGSNPNTAINKFIVSDEIVSDNSSFRNFIHVEDLASAISNVFYNIDNTRNETINIDGIVQYKISDIAQFVGNIRSAPVKIKGNATFSGIQMDNSKAKKLLSLIQNINLFEWITKKIKK